MAAITLQQVGILGLDIGALAAASGGGDTVQVTANEMGGWDVAPAALVFRNGDASAKTVAINGATPVSVAAGAIGIFPLKTGYGGANITVAYSAVTACTVGAFQLP
jgi:hypothetical protein